MHQHGARLFPPNGGALYGEKDTIMKRALSIAIVSAFALTSVPSFAGEKDLPPAVKAELKELTKLAGSGEISSKEYNKRKQALLASVEQSAEYNLYNTKK
jgi:hypothetical protein